MFRDLGVGGKRFEILCVERCLRMCVLGGCLRMCVGGCLRMCVGGCLRMCVGGCLRMCVGGSILKMCVKGF